MVLGYMGTTLSIFQFGFIMMMAHNGVTTRTFLKQCLFAKNMGGLCLINSDPSKLFETVNVLTNLFFLVKTHSEGPFNSRMTNQRTLKGYRFYLNYSFSNHFILVRGKVDLQPVLGTLGVM